MSRHLARHAELERLFGADFLPLSKSRPPAPRPAPAPDPCTTVVESLPSASRFPEGRFQERSGAERRDEMAEPAAAAAGLRHFTGGESQPVPVAAKPPCGYPPEFLEFRAPVLACTKCGLHATRTQVVFGVGPLGAPLMFVGEAPGGDEDLQGEPFVGRAGQLLTKTLKKIGVERGQVYIGNILKCRPPGNRVPQPDEMAACMPWLLQQIRFVGPKILCGLGNIAVQTLLSTKAGITRLRGKVTEAQGVKFLPTFHPAYILRNMGDLPLFEADLRLACREAGLVP